MNIMIINKNKSFSLKTFFIQVFRLFKYALIYLYSLYIYYCYDYNQLISKWAYFKSHDIFMKKVFKLKDLFLLIILMFIYRRTYIQKGYIEIMKNGQITAWYLCNEFIDFLTSISLIINELNSQYMRGV